MRAVSLTPGFLLGIGTQLFWAFMGAPTSLWKTALGANVIWGIPFGFLVMLAVWIALLVVAVLVYHRLPARAQTYWLLLLSYAFYTWWAWQFLPVLLFLGLVLGNVALARSSSLTRYAVMSAIGGQSDRTSLCPLLGIKRT